MSTLKVDVLRDVAETVSVDVVDISTGLAEAPVLRQDLADSTDPSKGAALIGYQSQTLSEYLEETGRLTSASIKSKQAVDLIHLMRSISTPTSPFMIGQQVDREGNVASSYNSLVLGLQSTAANVKPAICGFDLGPRADLAEQPATLEETLATALDWSINHGGFVAASWHTPNPFTWTGPQSGGGDQVGSSKDRLPLGTDMSPLWTEGTAVNELFKQFMDFIVDEFLEPMREAGVPVLWRPFHESTGRWFWWSAKVDSNTAPTTYERVSQEEYEHIFRYTYNYLVNIKGLNNLVWVYNAGYYTSGLPAPVPATHHYWAIRDLIDVVSQDIYKDSPSFEDVRALAMTGKPVALAEWGPTTRDGSYNVSRILDALKRNFPNIVYISAWWDVNGESYAWASQSNLGAIAFERSLLSLGDIAYVPGFTRGLNTQFSRFTSGIDFESDDFTAFARMYRPSSLANNRTAYIGLADASGIGRLQFSPRTDTGASKSIGFAMDLSTGHIFPLNSQGTDLGSITLPFRDVYSKDLVLISPDLSRWRISVSNSGTITSVKI